MKRGRLAAIMSLGVVGVAFAILLFVKSGEQQDTAVNAKALSAPPGMEQILHFPQEVIFWNVASGEERKADIYIRQNDDFPVQIEDVGSTVEPVHMEIVKSGGKDHRVYTLRATLSSKAVPGIFQGLINIKTNHPKKPKISIPVFWNVLNGLTIDPPAFGVQLTHTQRKAGGMIQITSTKKQKFEIKKIDAHFPGAKIDFKPMKECCGYFVAVLIDDQKYQITQSERSSLDIYTNLKEMERIVIPVAITAPVFAAPSEEKHPSEKKVRPPA